MAVSLNGSWIGKDIVQAALRRTAGQLLEKVPQTASAETELFEAIRRYNAAREKKSRG
jgi:hypothetical protein